MKKYIFFVFLITFIIFLLNCSFSGESYEKIIFEINDSLYSLSFNTVNYIDNGYYHIEASNEDKTMLIIIQFPAFTNDYSFILPYDNATEIRLYYLEKNYYYICSASGGNGLIVIDHYPDSLFNELSGTFNCEMININSSDDTLRIESGNFYFLF